MPKNLPAAYSLVPYEKGYLFLCAIEAAVGRESFSRWLRSYLTTFRFGAITTEDFVTHIEEGLPGALKAANATVWLDGVGIPGDTPPLRSARATAIVSLCTSSPSMMLRSCMTGSFRMELCVSVSRD